MSQNNALAPEAASRSSPLTLSLPPPPPPPMPTDQPVLSAEKRLKKVNWEKIAKHKITNNCFWAKQHGNLITSAEKKVFDELNELFSLPNQLPNQKVGEALDKKSDIRLHVLDNRAAQNLLITLRGLFKSASHKQIKKYILQCSTDNLNTFVVDTLIKYLPPPHAMEELQTMIHKGVELTEIEKFVASLNDIERLIPRLRCLKFMLSYDDMMDSLEPNMRAGSAACMEVISSGKFAEILKIILRIGNHMNAGSNMGGAIGFDLGVLNRLKDVKSSDKQTLLNYIVRTIEKLHPELLTFRYEIFHVIKAARINTQAIEESIQKLNESSQFLQSELEPCNFSLLTPMFKFFQRSRQEIEKVNELFDKMKTDYQHVAEYYIFDISKISIGEFFTTIKTFMNSFNEERVQCSPQKSKPVEIPRCFVSMKRKRWSEMEIAAELKRFKSMNGTKE